jgi:hypothetical protein
MNFTSDNIHELSPGDCVVLIGTELSFVITSVRDVLDVTGAIEAPITVVGVDSTLKLYHFTTTAYAFRRA